MNKTGKKEKAGEAGKTFEEKIRVLETRIRHLENELRLTKEESEQSIQNYYDLYSNMERKVIERTREFKALQKKMARAEKMEALGLLAGGVAHDGNNILAGIVGYLELLHISMAKDDENMEYVEGALDASRQMAAMINDLLTITRGGMEEKKPLSLNHLVEEFLASPTMLELKKIHAGVNVKTSLMSDLLNIKGDGYALSKVLLNLTSNAMDACKEGGVVEIATKNIYVEDGIAQADLKLSSGEYVVLTVRDNGVGIKKEDQSRIFEPFFTKKIMKRRGTGLGMTLVYQTIKEHDGIIEVNSVPEVGSTFDIYFSATREAFEIEVPENETRITDLEGKGEKILVVDDVESQRNILTNILSRLGYEASSAPSGEKAIELFKDNEFDLVVLDMIMPPGIDGLETYRRILTIRPGQKAVITSGFAETDRVKEALKIGAGQFVKKPYSLVRIGRVVKAELSKG
ncbi:MAG: response regulator [Deltaproteobacteria bacterium]|nr:response regulator [Deltaproteobacteria bacterium]